MLQNHHRLHASVKVLTVPELPQLTASPAVLNPHQLSTCCSITEPMHLLSWQKSNQIRNKEFSSKPANWINWERGMPLPARKGSSYATLLCTMHFQSWTHVNATTRTRTKGFPASRESSKFTPSQKPLFFLQLGRWNTSPVLAWRGPPVLCHCALAHAAGEF